MNRMISAQGADITTWRAVEHFAASYRQALLDPASSERFSNTETVFIETLAALGAKVSAQQKFLLDTRLLTEALSGSTPAERAGLIRSFYDQLYHHFELFRSAQAFYQLSMPFLMKLCETVIADATKQLGVAARELPEMALIAMGPAGRGEYSPFCRLQILLVHGEIAANRQESFSQFCNLLHNGFETAGVAVDPIVTPRNPKWRGTLAEWNQRLIMGLETHEDEELINLCRLIDQYQLYGAENFAGEFNKTGIAALRGSRPAMVNLTKRMSALSNGLGLMGRLKLEKAGSERGLFKLLDHGLLPFSAALSALSLISGSPALNSREKISELLRRGELAVDLAERMLETWHTLHGLRVWREQSLAFEGNAERSLSLNPEDMTAGQLQALTEALESVATIQQYVKITFSGTEE